MKRFAFGVLMGVVLAVIVSEAWGRFLPPIPDPGHRLFGAKGQKAAAVLLRVLEEHGMRPVMAFNTGPVHHVVLSDQRTEIAWFDENVATLPHNAISLAVSEPRQAADRARDVFSRFGFNSRIEIFRLDNGEELVLVDSDALDGNGIVFRKAWYKMGRPTESALPSIER
jgi:hypothetical protein